MKKINETRDDSRPLVDVRTKEEYDQGHLPGAVNVPLDTVDHADIADGSDLYCRSGHRSEIARSILEGRGIRTENIGGIKDYEGPIEK
ncbi:rhodanese-like domain-containing protein [Faecalibaculum rodentium]|uniref:rhodanese-like domain-containing protein n=1 Tax=Faecalibaculum rodentium TaxID=1702221 RepID=UPI0023F55FB2|nr:rhodanese-like domain-containing protein [Faecalibaculum rodentium]